ncbi:MAG: LysM peptidoglycan-binding domain-containing protein [Anaerolineales bacterium]|nr:LysM peptidoglycan-binding domain-containing protein [Anaerolineales bacterium]MCB8960532.1 LysM peptidoglycan-binding domain-containing protein [Ardenticatenales bacterium]MCB0005431.1 LysM peptidoglycan-binding domain-containing protein [Anaerolineales bacterium]MCB0013361.1 LysM peptidoglycan-binding domain-containing protein [Anaerolineales bacterium]MCB0019997.1 LysM peptidoglycan-binding domain-containing protein [Anaerolineales bacterium]
MASDDLKKSMAGKLGRAEKGNKAKVESLGQDAKERSDKLAEAAKGILAGKRVEAAKSQKSYTVVAGDSLSAIAQKQYGSADKWQAIYEANKELIGDNPNAIRVGQELILPDLD